MNRLTIFPGDLAVVNGVAFAVDRTVTLTSDAVIGRRPAPGMSDLPETPLRIDQLWRRGGHRAPMSLRRDLRCPCGSAYVRQSATHHSCQHCQRVWENREVATGGEHRRVSDDANQEGDCNG